MGTALTRSVPTLEDLMMNLVMKACSFRPRAHIAELETHAQQRKKMEKQKGQAYVRKKKSLN